MVDENRGGDDHVVENEQYPQQAKVDLRTQHEAAERRVEAHPEARLCQDTALRIKSEFWGAYLQTKCRPDGSLGSSWLITLEPTTSTAGAHQSHKQKSETYSHFPINEKAISEFARKHGEGANPAQR